MLFPARCSTRVLFILTQKERTDNVVCVCALLFFQIVEILHYWLKADWSSDSALKTFDCIPKFVPFLQQARVQLRTVGGCEEKVNALLHAFRC